MTLSRLAAFTIHWADIPPMHVSFAGLLKGLAGKKQQQGVEVDGMPAPARKRLGFPDVPTHREANRQGNRVENLSEVLPPKPAGQMYDAPDPKSPMFQKAFQGLGEIHFIKSKSPRAD